MVTLRQTYDEHGDGSEEGVELLGRTLVALKHVAVLDSRPGGRAAARGRRHGACMAMQSAAA